jgi:hypothetical protein
MLSDRDRRLLSHLAKHETGLPVKMDHVETFGAYEGSGLVRLSAARVGPLGLPDEDHFWARITPEGRTVLDAQPGER